MAARRRQGMWLGAAMSTALIQRIRSAKPEVPESWSRINFRGHRVDMYAGPALAVAAAAGSAVTGGGLGVPVAVLGAAAVGRLDDVRGAHPGEKHDKGLAGHARALTEGRLSAGAIKVVGLTGVGLAASLMNGKRGQTRGWLDLVLDATCIAGMANVVNLFDLRPGRALKVGGGLALLVGPFAPGGSAIAGAALGVLGPDLRESSMLGDAGANALGAGLGAVLVRNRGRLSRFCIAGGVAVTALVSEKVSFSAVIEGSTVLRTLDNAGRLRGSGDVAP